MKELKYDPRKGYWVSDERLKFELDDPIQNVKEFGDALVKFLELFKKEIPFTPKRVYPLYVNQVWDKEKSSFFKEGYVIIEVQRKSLRSKLNPFHDKMEGDETISINFGLGDKYFTSYQERKSEYVGCRYTWKLRINEIANFISLLEKFAAGCWAGLDKLILGKDEVSEHEEP